MKRKVIIAPNAGFCEGVKRAVDLATKAIELNKNSTKIYSLGRLVHNSFVVEEFKKLGLSQVNSLDEISEPGYLIISAHGVAPKIYEEAKKKPLTLIDTTCPWVKKVQELGRKLSQNKYQVVIVGDREHPEVKGVVEWAGGQALVVEKPEDIQILDSNKKTGLLAQTTQSFEGFGKIARILKKKIKDLTIYKTICGATEKRQKSAMALAKKVKVVFVIGDEASANTRRLFQLCSQINPRTYHIQSAADLKKQMVLSEKNIGLTAGASTPDWIIQEVINKIKNETF